MRQDQRGADSCWTWVMGPQVVVLSFCLLLFTFEIFHRSHYFRNFPTNPCPSGANIPVGEDKQSKGYSMAGDSKCFGDK